MLSFPALRFALTLFALPAFASARPPVNAPVRFVVLSSASDDATRGAQMGVEEAGHTASLVGAAPPGLVIDSSANGSAAATGTGGSVTAYIGGADPASCSRGIALARSAGGIFMALQCTGQSPLVFHLRPTEPGELWQPTLKAFGAAQLNDRFAARFNAPMSSEAWAGWMAVKIVTEAALRTRSSDPKALATYMLDSATRFDGHKGKALRFSPGDQRLVQPVYGPSR